MSCFLFLITICSVAGTFVLSNLGMFGVDRFDAILPPGMVNEALYPVSNLSCLRSFYIFKILHLC